MSNSTSHVDANTAAALENLGIKTVTNADGTISTAAGKGQVATDA